MPYLIDGHNLIAHLPDIDLADPHDEARLVNKLKSFAAGRRAKCTVIFDGGLPGGQSSLSTRGVSVIFASAAHSSADDLIKRRIANLSDKRGWTVVSSDRDIQASARRYRVKTMTAADFTYAMQRPEPPAGTAPGEEIDPDIPAGDIEDWLDIFGGDETN